MDLGNLQYANGSRRPKKRIGRGQGSGIGGTAGRGDKGQRSRSGSKIRPWFEGGQMPLQRRLPKRGFTNIFKKEFQLVNISDLKRAGRTSKIDPVVLHKKGIIAKKNVPVKILGVGEVKSALQLQLS